MSLNDVLTDLESHHDRILDDLIDFAAIPSVSTNPAHAGDIERAARWVASAIEAAGPFTVSRMETARHPAIYAEWLGASGAPQKETTTG